MFDRHYPERGKGHYYRREARRPQEPLRPRLLLLLLQKPGHGYELMERLSGDKEIPDADPGRLYRTLRRLEEDGMVRSEWDTEGGGPARRLYRVTPEGTECLRAWADDIRRLDGQLVRFLEEYEVYLENEKKG